MVHIYRQITALKRFRPAVIAQKRDEAERFPFDNLTVVPKAPLHFLRRLWYKQIRDVPWQISRAELKSILSVLQRENAQLLHIYFGHIAVHLLPLIRAWTRPAVVSFHGADVMIDLEKPAYRAATRQMLSAVRLVLVRSESLRDALIELGCDDEKIRLQRTGIPLKEIAYRQRVWPTDGRWHLLQAGRLIAKKGVATSLRAFASFAHSYPQSSLTIAGDGPLRSELENLAREFKIAERVRFTGFVSQSKLRELFYSSHIFLHPSELGSDGNQEGVPNSMLEAMASGLPVFATSHGGIPEAVEDGVSGVLVSERNADALARELSAAVAAPGSLEELALAGSELVAKKFELRAQVRNLEDCYAEAIGSSL